MPLYRLDLTKNDIYLLYGICGITPQFAPESKRRKNYTILYHSESDEGILDITDFIVELESEISDIKILRINKCVFESVIMDFVERYDRHLHKDFRFYQNIR